MTIKIELLERNFEVSSIVSAVEGGSRDLLFAPKGFCITGPAEVGKTWLVERVKTETANLQNVVAIEGNLDANWESLDPIERLVGLRNSLARQFHLFDPAAFDLCFPVFLAKFRPGYGYSIERAKKPSGLPFEETIIDASKKGIESAIDDITTSGASAGGTAVLAGAAKAAASGGLWVATSAVAVAAATAGIITFVTVISALKCKKLIRRQRRRARYKGLFRRYDQMAHFMSSDCQDYDEFLSFLTYLIGDAVASMHDGRRGFLSVLIFDPTHGICRHPEGPATPVAQMLTEVFDNSGRRVAVVTSRMSMKEWQSTTSKFGCAPELVYTEFALDHLSIVEAERAARERGYDGNWPPSNISLVDEHQVAPKAFADWMKTLDAPPVEESEGL